MKETHRSRGRDAFVIACMFFVLGWASHMRLSSNEGVGQCVAPAPIYQPEAPQKKSASVIEV